MKKSIFSIIIILFCTSIAGKLYAQTDASRNKMVLLIQFGGKVITADLTAVSTSITNSNGYDDESSQVTPDSLKAKTGQNVFYLALNLKSMPIELLKLMAKKQTRFDGMISITDSYGKYPTQTIKFNGGSINSYNDSFSADSYGDSYGTTTLSISCMKLEINGVKLLE